MMKLIPLSELLDRATDALAPHGATPIRTDDGTKAGTWEDAARRNLRALHTVQLVKMLGRGEVVARDPFSRAPIAARDLMPNGTHPHDLGRYVVTEADAAKFFAHLAIDPTQRATARPKAPRSPKSPRQQSDWKDHAQALARRIIERDTSRKLHPSQVLIAEELARELDQQGIRGPAGIPLTASYIKRHALAGITSAAPARRATPHKRGK